MADKPNLTKEDLDDLEAELLPERTQMSVLWHAGPAVVPEDIGVPTDPDAAVETSPEST
jgi:hypothetical protein